jgi:hypothetical protein
MASPPMGVRQRMGADINRTGADGKTGQSIGTGSPGVGGRLR